MTERTSSLIKINTLDNKLINKNKREWKSFKNGQSENPKECFNMKLKGKHSIQGLSPQQ